jgi:hypothetical protein
MAEYEFERNTKMEYTNPDAKVVIVGITPGNSQLENNRENKSPKEIKKENSFAGSNMRRNLTDMLDHSGINDVLGIESCKTIFDEDFDKVECTSLLKDATFEVKNGEKKMFNQPSKIMKNDDLKKELENGFLEDCKNYTNSKVIVALGKETEKLLKQQQDSGKIDQNIEIIGIPHPSGANQGRINTFLGEEKPKNDASYDWAEQAAKNAKKAVKNILNSQSNSNTTKKSSK